MTQFSARFFRMRTLHLLKISQPGSALPTGTLLMIILKLVDSSPISGLTKNLFKITLKLARELQISLHFWELPASIGLSRMCLEFIQEPDLVLVFLMMTSLLWKIRNAHVRKQ